LNTDVITGKFKEINNNIKLSINESKERISTVKNEKYKDIIEEIKKKELISS
jgi:hypothetical protein